MSSRFVIGIDLGTTNSALAFVDTTAGKDAKVTPFPIPQVVAQGSVEDRPLLPSFLYLPGEGEQPAGALKLPWDAKRDYAVGEFARAFGSQVPTRLVASAKSWLCHPGVDRKAGRPAVVCLRSYRVGVSFRSRRYDAHGTDGQSLRMQRCK